MIKEMKETMLEQQNEKIIRLREAKKVVLRECDILLTEEAEKLYHDAINSLNKVINMEIDELKELERK
jgi:hypothetical protein